MAIYVYRCGADGDFDLVVPVGTAPPDLICPSCGEESTRVLLSASQCRTRERPRLVLDRSGDVTPAAG